jgi:hypothetical protein
MQLSGFFTCPAGRGGLGRVFFVEPIAELEARDFPQAPLLGKLEGISGQQILFASQYIWSVWSVNIFGGLFVTVFAPSDKTDGRYKPWIKANKLSGRLKCRLPAASGSEFEFLDLDENNKEAS